MKKGPLYFLAITFFSCSVGKPINRETSENNQTYKIDYLFEHEGCKVYRFRDKGNYVYFTNCNGEAITKNDSTEIRNSTKAIQNNK